MTKWTLRAHDAALVEQIERSAGVSPVVAQILALRGITHPGDVNSFLDLRMTGLRPPAELPGLEQASEVIFDAVRAGKKILIYGDYDADGMTATAIMCRCLNKIGADVSYFVPNRLDDGYGVNGDSLRKLHDRGAQLIVTVDCGIGSVEEVQLARDLGMQMVVTDHHHIGGELPAADALVHPALPASDEYPFAGLCGAGVAFKLAWSLCQRQCNSEKLPEDYRHMLFGCVSF